MQMKKWIMAATVAALVLGGCGDKKSQEHEAQAQNTQKAAPVKHAESVSKSEIPAAKKKSVSTSADETAKDLHKKIDEAKKAVEESVKKAGEQIKKTGEKVAEQIKERSEKSSQIDAATLFTKCAGCHGTKGEKHALGKSNIIAGQSKADLIRKIEGYQKGTYGGAMKSLMQGQVKNLSAQQIEALAEYISKL